MSTLREAADALDRHHKTLDAFKTAADALRGLDSLANAEKVLFFFLVGSDLAGSS